MALSLRLDFADGGRLGPGKAALLAHIRDTGSIAAAARAMGMSYKRAWTLVDSLNRGFARALVIRTRGGAAQGGARLSETGEAVLIHYRAIEARARAAAEIAALAALRREGGAETD